MAYNNVINVIFSNSRKVDLNWSWEAAYANYNFFQMSSAFHKTNNCVSLEKEKETINNENN